MKQTKVALFDAKPYDIESFTNQNKDFGFEIKYFKNHLTLDTVSLAKDYDIICAFVNDTLDKPVLEKLIEYGIKLVALRCAGYNNVALNVAYKNIHIARVPRYSPYAVAEHTLALIMTLNRKTHKAYNRVRDNNFTINGFLGFDMNGKTAGIIGTGKIGQILIKILHGLGVNILAYDLYPNQDIVEKYNVQYTDLKNLYRQSDIITLNCPLTQETQHMINDKSISEMKDGVMMINTGRGQLIDTKALINGLKNKKIGSAGLDVYEEESQYFFEDFSHTIIDDDVLARLLTFNNVLITSHQAFFTREALKNIADTTLNNILEYQEKHMLTNEICYKCDINNCQKKPEKMCFQLKGDK